MTPPMFMQVIEASGFSPTHSTNIAAAGTPRAGEDMEQAAVARLPEFVRSAVEVAGAGGAVTRELLESFPEPLRSELLRIFSAGGCLIASVALMHYLPELIREVAERERDLLGAGTHPPQIGSRFFTGGSETLSWPRGGLLWPGFPQLPSSAGPSAGGRDTPG